MTVAVAGPDAPTTKTTQRQHVANMVKPILVVAAAYLVAAGVFIACFGWGRLHDDFWPLDSSRVGPNLCASFALLIALVVHSEYVTEERARQRHESHKQAVQDAFDVLLTPTEDAEANIAAQVEEDFRRDVLDRLDETTPKGLGTIYSALTTPTKGAK